MYAKTSAWMQFGFSCLLLIAVLFVSYGVFSRNFCFSSCGYRGKYSVPVVIGGVPSVKHLYGKKVKISFRVKVDSVKEYDNIFQTAPANSGIRMEVGNGVHNSIGAVIGDKKLGLRGFVLTDNFGLKKWHEVLMTISRENEVSISLDGKSVVKETVPELNYELTDIVLGTGFGRSRPLNGTVEDFRIEGQLFYRLFSGKSILLFQLLASIFFIISFLQIRLQLISSFHKFFRPLQAVLTALGEFFRNYYSRGVVCFERTGIMKHAQMILISCCVLISAFSIFRLAVYPGLLDSFKPDTLLYAGALCVGLILWVISVGRCRNSCFIFAIITFFLLLAFVFLSDFSYHLFYKTRYSEVFFDMWKRLIVGDVGVTSSVLIGERFIVNGKVIAYFLPFPALIRGIFSLFGLGEYPLPSMLAATFCYSLSVYYLFREVLFFTRTRERDAVLTAWYPFFLIPLVSLFVEASVYWESLFWSVALFIAQAYFYLSFLRDGKLSKKYLLLLVSALILFTRPTYGAASCIMVLLLLVRDLRRGDRAPRSLLPYSFFIAALSLLLLLNYQRWGSPFKFASLPDHEQLIGTERGRMAAISPSLTFKRIPETLDYYFSVSPHNFSSSPPFIKVGKRSFPFNLAYFDYKEDYYSILLSLPFHCMAALVGAFVLFRRNKQLSDPGWKFRSYLFISFIPVFVILMMFAMALRYRSEFFGVLLVSSMIGIAYLQDRLTRRKIILTAFLLIIAAFLFVLHGLFVERIMIFGLQRNPQAVCSGFGI